MKSEDMKSEDMKKKNVHSLQPTAYMRRVIS